MSRDVQILKNMNIDQSHQLKRGINGGFPCAACSVLLGMSEQLADINNGTLFSGLDIMCSYLPTELGSQCSILIHVFGPTVIDFFNYGSSPDEICYEVGLCVDENETGMCHLFPTKQGKKLSTVTPQKLSTEQIKHISDIIFIFP